MDDRSAADGRELDRLAREWEPTRRRLAQPAQRHWDHMWVHANDHADAAAKSAPDDPLPAALLSICLGQQREIAELSERLARLEVLLDR